MFTARILQQEAVAHRQIPCSIAKVPVVRVSCAVRFEVSARSFRAGKFRERRLLLIHLRTALDIFIRVPALL